MANTGLNKSIWIGPNDSLIGSCPLDCPDGCSWVLSVVEEGSRCGSEPKLKLRGNPDHPFTAGSLCKKVNPWLSYAADPGRILTPLRRVKPKGPQHRPAEAFVTVGWDEALDEIAARLSELIESGGPEVVWPFWGTGNVGFLQGAGLGAKAALWNRLAVSDHNLSICSVSGRVGLGYSMGTTTSLNPEEIVDAATILLWGSNPLVSGHHLWPIIEKARAGGARVVVIDPIKTRSAARADVHIAPRVGSDGALALGLCRLLIDSEAVDIDFLNDHTIGYEGFREMVLSWPLERSVKACGLERSVIEDLANLIAHDPKVVFKLGQGMQRHGSGGQSARIISCLAALCGSFKYRGCGLTYSTSSVYELNVAKAGAAHLLSGQRRRLTMTNLAANLLGPLDPPVKALLVFCANPVVSNPDTDRVRQGLQRPDLFTVVSELFHTPTTDYADFVLPSTMQHEQWELNHSFAHVHLNLNRPAVTAPGQCLPHSEMLRRLAAALELDDPELFIDDEALLSALLDTPGLEDSGVDLDYLKQKGWATMSAGLGLNLVADGFPTQSGRFEFSSEKAAADGYGRLPYYGEPYEAGRDLGSRGYDLVAASCDAFLNTVFSQTEVVAKRHTVPTVRLHPEDAARDGLSSGQRVRLWNDRGSFEARLAVDDTARRGVAWTEKGWAEMGLNATVAEVDSDMGGGAVFHDNRVYIDAL